MSPQETREGLAEALGTFMLVLVGAGALAMSPGNVVAIALAHGLILAAIVATYGHISGAHVNPAVTLGLLVGGKIGPRKAVIYWVAQIAGGLLAAVVLRIALPSGQAGVSTLGQTAPGSGVTTGQLILIEAIITFFLVGTVYQASVYNKGGAATPVLIGFTLAAAILLAGPLTGGSANFARTLGPALVAKDTQDLGEVLQYAIGILGGGALAGLLHGDLFALREEPKTPAAKKR